MKALPPAHEGQSYFRIRVGREQHRGAAPHPVTRTSVPGWPEHTISTVPEKAAGSE